MKKFYLLYEISFFSRPLLILLLFSFYITDVLGAPKTFTGGAGFTFGTAAKWSGGTLPVAGDDLTINGICIVDNNVLTNNVAYGSLTVGGASNGTLSWAVGGTNIIKCTDFTSAFAGSTLDMTNGGKIIVTNVIGSITNFICGTGTIERQLNGANMASLTPYNNLIINSPGGTITTGINTIINGTLTISAGTTLNWGGFNLTVSGTTTVGGTLRLSSTTGTKTFNNLLISGTFNNSANEPFNVSGDFQNNGTFTSGTGRVTFNGAASNTITGISSSAFGGGITINKGVSNANILDVQSLITISAGGLILTNGTFKLSSNSTITPFIADITVSPYLIPSTAGLWCNGGTMSASTMNWTIAGLLKITGGSITVGNAAENLLIPRSTASIVIEGGNLNLASRISNTTVSWGLSITSGTMTINTAGSTAAGYAAFNMDATGCSFSMSGGTIVIQRSAGSAGQNLGFYNLATSGTGFTGGILQIGNSLTPASSTIGITSTRAIYNLTVDCLNSAAQQNSTTLTLDGNLQLTNGTFNKGTGTTLNIAGNLVFNAGTTFQKGTGTTNFNGTAKTITDNTAALQDLGAVAVQSAQSVALSTSAKMTTLGGAGTITLNANTLKLLGSGTVLSITTFNASTSSTTEFACTGNCDVPALTYYHLTINSLGFTANSGTGISAVNNISIITGASFMVNDATLQIAGSISNGGVFDVTNGTVEMNGTSEQTIPAGTFVNNTIKNLVISNNVSLEGQDTLTGTLTMTGNGKTFATNDFLTLKSTASGTASVAPIPVDAFGVALNFITGNVIVERYIPGHRAYRLLSVPVVTSQTINQAWQEGVANTTLTYPGGNNNPNPGYGTHITGIAGGTGIGYDAGPQNNYSLKIYDRVGTTTVTAGYKGIQQLYPGQGTNNTSLNFLEGYMLFVRGNRNTNLNSGAGAALSNTILRAKGTLKTGTQPAVPTLTGFNVIGNPFAATIDMRRIEKTGAVSDFFYLYDTRLGTLGDFQTFLWDGTNYVPLPGGGSYAAPYATAGSANFIQSGQAFFVESAGAGSVIIKEVAKELTTNSMIFSPVTQVQQLRTNLYTVNTSTNLLDATLTQFSSNGNNAVDGKDAIKIQSLSGGTYLGMQRNGINLVIERKQSIMVNDTIFFNLMSASKRDYRFEFIADKLDENAVSGFLEDAYLRTSVPVNLNDTTTAHFTVNGDAASSAADRFRIVFEAKFNILPLPFTFNVRAKEENNNIAIEWTTENEEHIKSYDVETSANGLQFAKAATVTSKRSTTTEKYQWVDTNADPGVHYYRIRSINENEEVLYSSIVKVVVNTDESEIAVYPKPVIKRRMKVVVNMDKSEIVVYPNPVVNGKINVKFINEPKGKYVLTLIDNLGRVLIRKETYLSESNLLETIKAGKNRIGGAYRLKVIKPDNDVISIHVILQKNFKWD